VSLGLGCGSGAGTLRAAESIVIGVIGDYGSAWKGASRAVNEKAVADLVQSWQPDLIITVGDNNYPSGAAESIDVNIGQFYHQYIHPYVGTYGPGAETNRFFPSLGNHDWGFPFPSLDAIQPYLDYFELPGNERYYSYRYGNVELFALSTDDAEPDGNTLDSTQAGWLRDALAASTATWRIVYGHDPPYSSGLLHGTYRHESEGTKMRQWPFQAWGASVVLSGHDHIYERIFTNDLTYIVCGTGGDRLDSVHLPLVPGSQTNITHVYGALRLTATATQLTLEFVSVDGVVMDRHVIESAQPPALALEQIGPPVEIELRGRPDRDYVLEASDDLTTWTPIQTNRAPDGVIRFLDPDAAGGPQRFYRAHEQP